MKISGRIFYLLFFICVTADSIYILVGQNSWRYFTKPLLIPFLMLGYYAEVKQITLFSKLLLGALFFSWMGDVLLMFDSHDQLFFVAGLVCFLTTHILYIRYFQKIESPQQSFFRKRPVMLLAIAAYSIELVYFLWPGLGAMKLPVIIYASVISLMLAAALWLYGKLANSTALFFISGALLFVASDSMLAINKFKHEFPYAGVLIMLTYCAAQFCLVRGGVRHLKDEG